jgi:hypothetical protein
MIGDTAEENNSRSCLAASSRLFQSLGISKFMDSYFLNSEIHLLRIAKFALGVRQFIAAFNDGIYSVPEVR